MQQECESAQIESEWPRYKIPVYMAPMVGLSHIAFRMLVKSYLPKKCTTLWPTEMLNSRRLPGEKVGSTLQTLKDESEVGLHPQILGNEREDIARSIKKLEEWGAVGVDINMGCPVKKALKHNYGVALMGDAGYAKQVAKFAVESSHLPVSVKIRAGLQNDKDFLLRFIGGFEDVGVSWICLHPRLAAQKRRGVSDWTQIKFLKKNAKIPIIGNGDIQIVDDIFRMMTDTNCDGVMIGRALTARPWLLAQYAKIQDPTLSVDFDWPESNEDEAYLYGKSLLKFVEYCQKYFPVEHGVKRLRFHVKTGHGWLNFGHSLYAKIQKVETYPEAREVIELFFKSGGLRFTNYTSLR